MTIEIYKANNPWHTHPWMVRRDGELVAMSETFEAAKQWVLEWEGEVDEPANEESILVSVEQ